VLPGDVASLVVDGFEDSLGDAATAATTVALRLGIVIGEIRDAVALLAVDVEEAGVGVEAGRRPVGSATAGDRGGSGQWGRPTRPSERQTVPRPARTVPLPAPGDRS